MDYTILKEASEKWNITPRMITPPVVFPVRKGKGLFGSSRKTQKNR